MSDSTADRAAVTELVYRYARAVDGRDIAGIVGCFTDDAHVAFNGGDHVTDGSTALRHFFEAAFRGALLGEQGVSTHIMSNVLVTVDVDAAHAETQAVAYLASDGRPNIVVRGLLYSDECVRKDAIWRIQNRMHTAVWQAEMPRLPLSPAFGERQNG